MSKVIVVAVHPDDETLGCGGTLLKHKSNGDNIFWLIVTNILNDYGWDENRVALRQKEIDKVAMLYDFDKTFKLDFPTTSLDDIPTKKIVRAISEVFLEVEPNIVYLLHRGDVHSDHRIAFEAAYSCTKNFRYPFVKEILMMETLSETEFGQASPENAFIPNVFNDISDFIERKIHIFRNFESEVMLNNLPRSESAIRALSAYRGSRIGAGYAEAFQLLLSIK